MFILFYLSDINDDDDDDDVDDDDVVRPVAQRRRPRRRPRINWDSKYTSYVAFIAADAVGVYSLAVWLLL